MARIVLSIRADMSQEHAVSLLSDLTRHVQRYNPRVIETVTGTVDGTADVVQVGITREGD